jgi:hypothetical protein
MKRKERRLERFGPPMKVKVKFEGKENEVSLTFNSPVVFDAHRVANAKPLSMGIPDKYNVKVNGKSGDSATPLTENALVEFTKK